MSLRFVTALTMLFSLACLPFQKDSRSPFHPDLGSPEGRKAAFAAEFAKHPEAPACATFKEVSVSTTGKRSIWTLECSDGLLVDMYVETDGSIVGSAASGYSKSAE